jgi:hypothetical protein
MTVEELNEREVRVLEHLQKAQELDVTIAEYARSFDVDAKELYAIRQALIRKGALPRRSSDEDEDIVEAAEPVRSDFVPVKVSLSHAPILGDTMCRIRHPSGVVIECASLPPAAWLMALLTGARSVPA